MSDGAARLSAYPQPKIVVACPKCGLRAQYDKLAMIEAGGDRRLTDLLREIAKRNGCRRIGVRVAHGDECGAVFANLT